MKIYLMTDLEGVAGVLNAQEWIEPSQRYYDLGRELLTLEVNAAVDGFFAGGATEVLVVDGHGAGALDVPRLDERVQFLRGWGAGPYPLCLDESFDAIAWVGQHAKAGTEFGHMAHTQSFAYLDMTVNGISIGEFGQMVLCASELGVRAIFGSGDDAFTKEARGLVPGIETVAVKWGVKPGSGDELTAEEYARFTASARHLHPARARRLIREGALRAIQRAREEEFGLLSLTPPFERVITTRPTEATPYRTLSRAAHPTSVIALMNMPAEVGRGGE